MKRSSFVLVVTVPLLIVGGVLVWRAGNRAGRNEKAVAGEQEGAPASRGEGVSSEAASLRAEMAALRGQVAAVRLQAQAPVSGAGETGAAVPARQPGLRDAEQLAKHQQGLRDQAAKLEAAFRKESTDVRWSADTTKLVEAAFLADDVGLKSFHDLSCRSQTCRVEIPNDASATFNEVMPTVALKLAGSLPSIFASRIDGPNGPTTVLYLQRPDSSPAEPR